MSDSSVAISFLDLSTIDPAVSLPRLASEPLLLELDPSDHGLDHGPGTPDHSQEGHAHGAGPHNGTLADWGGGKFQVEFTVDHDAANASSGSSRV